MAKIPRDKRTSKNRFESAGELLTTPAGSVLPPRQTPSPQSEIQRLRNRVDELEKELKRLQGALGDAATQKSSGPRVLDHELVASQLHYGELATLYVASARLAGKLRHEDILEAIREIVINLIGVEEMAVYKNNPRKSTLSIIDSYGDLPAHRLDISFGQGPTASVPLTCDCYFRDVSGAAQRTDNEEIATARVPLKVNGALWGLIVIYRFLPQKERLSALDFQLFELLSAQAGVALYCAELNAQRRANRKGAA